MRTVSYVFQRRIGRAVASYSCAICGKRREKRFSVEFTVNPFNVDENGRAKSSERVSLDARAEAHARRDKFMERPLCSVCSGMRASPQPIAAE